jgi:branched-chain amino acid aminotransferase
MNVLHDGLLAREENPDELFHDGVSLYEVFRVYKGRLLFPGDNIARLENSVRKSGLELPLSLAGIATRLKRVIRLEEMTEGNIKYVLHATARGVEEYVYRVPHDYPTADDYRDGVRAMTLRASRENAEVKYIHRELRETTDRLIREHGVREVLLVDEEGYVTEGSRSNVFFVRGDALYTAPLPHVLPGTTRDRVLRLCAAEGIPVIERRVSLAGIPLTRAAFLTGTSPLVLPLRQIDETPMDPRDPLLRRVMERYFALLQEG